MLAIEIIQKKRDCHSLTKEEISFLIEHYVSGDIPDYQMASFLMATYLNGMTDEETSWLTDAMLWSGTVIEHPNNGMPIIDKHSTGGVGDKMSIPLAPMVAACGVKVPMIAGRGLGHTGGTLDKLEAIPGFRCNLSADDYRMIVAEIGCVIMGQTSDIAPADKKIYALRDVTSTVESIPLISSSIMSKKLAEGIDGIVLDVKYGSGAFMKDVNRARLLAQSMAKIGAHMGKKVTCLLTNMDQPLGRMVGNALEILETIDILQGKGPHDAVELTIELGAEMMMLANKATSLADGRRMMEETLSSGLAYKKFLQMVKAQGGDVSYIEEPSKLSLAPQRITIVAHNSGFIKAIDSRTVGAAANLLGGGRNTILDEVDHGVGIEVLVKIGQPIEKGQPLCTLFARDLGIDEANKRLSSAFLISESSVAKPDLIGDRISSLH